MKEKYLIAIDFETANSSPLSVCQIGIIVFYQGELVFEFESLVKPPSDYGEFNYYNTKVHGITEDQVVDAKEWDQVFLEFESYLKDGILVAHNAAFDLRVLKAINEYYDIKIKPIDYYCTVELARKVFPYLANHKLNTVANHLDIQLDHHNAKSDAYAAAMIVFKSAQIISVKNFSDLFAKTNMKTKTLTM